MIGIEKKETNLIPTIGTVGLPLPLGVYKSGIAVSILLKDKYSRLLQGSFSLEDLPEDWEPVIRQYKIPVNLSRDLIEGIGLEAKHVANVLVFLPLIKYITDFKEVINRKKKFTDGAQINSQILREFLLTLGNKTKDFLVKLEKEKWIEVNHSYKVTERSKQYKIGPKFKNVEWVEVDWKENLEKFLPEILEKSYIARRKEVLYDLWNRASCYFLDWRDMPEGQARDLCEFTSRISLRLSVEGSEGDIEAAIIQAANKHVSEAIDKGGHIPTVEKMISFYGKALNKIGGEDFYVILHDERYRYPTFRMFTPFTNLKKELRKFVRLDGRELVNIDIRACQVALLSTFYTESEEDLQEKKKFEQKIITEDIYDYLADGKFTRDSAKKAMFKVMFDKTLHQSGPIYEKFKAEFPILCDRVAEIKRGNYKNAAFLMQRKEAGIMILGALSELLLAENINCLSIHDSISCFPEDSEKVKSVISKHFYKEMGFYPNVRKD